MNYGAMEFSRRIKKRKSRAAKVREESKPRVPAIIPPDVDPELLAPRGLLQYLPSPRFAFQPCKIFPTKLHEVFESVDTVITANPANSSIINQQIDLFLSTLVSMGFRPLNSIRCVCKYITFVGSLFEELMLMPLDDEPILYTLDVVENFFREMDLKIREIVTTGGYADDFRVVETRRIYAMIYSSLLVVVENYKQMMLGMLSSRAMTETMYPSSELYRGDLMYLISQFPGPPELESWRPRHIVQDLAEQRKYLYDGSYFKKNLDDWLNFVDGYLNC